MIQRENAPATPPRAVRPWLLSLASLLITGLLWTAPAAAAPRTAPYLALFPDFAPALTPVLPGDVATALKASLERDGKFALVQRLFDLYAWQMFTAVNWPTSSAGTPAPAFTSPGSPRWAGWVTADALFRKIPRAPEACRNPGARSANSITGGERGSGRVLRLISSVRDLDVRSIPEAKDATDGPLIDQHGHFVYYESLLDPNGTAFVCEYALYNSAGQAAYMAHHHRVDFPAGQEDVASSGSFSVKLAWKVLDRSKGDEPARFFTMPATILDLDRAGQPVERHVLVGLVGMHIVHKSITAPQRIWATFEQVDNLAIDPVAHPGLRPSFFDPDCALCLPNRPPRPNAHGGYDRTPVQAMRILPIAPDTAHLDAEARVVFAGLGSVWRHYRLIGTEWPTVPGASPAGPSADRTEAILDRSGGAPALPFLANVTMETYFQAMAQPSCPLERSPSAGACVSLASPLYAGQNSAPSAGTASVFGGTGCMACHASAGAIIHVDPASGRRTTGAPLSGDFSWFLTQNITAQESARP